MHETAALAGIAGPVLVLQRDHLVGRVDPDLLVGGLGVAATLTGLLRVGQLTREDGDRATCPPVPALAGTVISTVTLSTRRTPTLPSWPWARVHRRRSAASGGSHG